uniref:TetR/AcrR family transcriptional regulator n=1 Tax=Gordonia sp. B7-2 TaxID=3420932 RepID=UPI003D91EACC
MTAQPGTTPSDVPAADAGAPRRRRPAARRQFILDAAAKAFSAGGFHTVRLEDIADAVGISAPALYRHFPTKYALFAETTAQLAHGLSGAVKGVEPGSPTELDDLLSAITTTSIENRRTGGLYRWEARYLEGADADLVREVVINQHRRIRAALQRRRPGLSDADADLITAAMTSVVASPATHRAALPAREAHTLIRDAATDLVQVDLPPPTDPTTATPGTGLLPAAKREVVLAESIHLFAARGFRDVTIDDIARAAGIPASGVYRHYPSKSAILEAAFWRAAERVTASITDALAASSTPREAIVALVTRYVGLTCGSTELITVYVTEIGHVGPTQRTALRNQQRLTVEEWATWVTRWRPDLSATQARFLVHAALNVIIDLARLPQQPSEARITALSSRILLGE